MLRALLHFAVALVVCPASFAQTFYVAPSGADTNSGSLASPFRTIPKAVGLASPGTKIVVRQGTYTISSVITINASGTGTDTCVLMAFPGERAIIDGSSMTVGGTNRGIALAGSFWHIRGFDVVRAGDNGMRVTGSHNVIEDCSFGENSDTGLQLDNGASSNLILNCDSYGNADPSQGNADGFAAKLGVGTGNRFSGCRAWANSDDGWDGYLRGADDVTTTLDNCWIFQNGYLSNGNTSSGNGNGFKLGGSDSANLAHNVVLKRCLAFDNRVKGFDQNNDRGAMTLLNCTSYRNGTNFSIPLALRASKTLTIGNCVSLGPYGTLGSFALQMTNSWNPGFTVTEADFQSVDTTGVRASRKGDGSLPDLKFMRLAAGSDLINTGTNVGLPFSGPAPDLGAFESDTPDDVNTEARTTETFALHQNYPNPFNASTVIRYQLSVANFVRLVVFDILGREVALLVNERQEGGTFTVRFDAPGLASGLYYCRLTAGEYTVTRRMALLR